MLRMWQLRSTPSLVFYVPRPVTASGNVFLPVTPYSFIDYTDNGRGHKTRRRPTSEYFTFAYVVYARYVRDVGGNKFETSLGVVKDH